MVVRARSLVAVLSGMAAFPLAAHASFSFGKPSFSCNADSFVSGINWGDGSSLGAPMVAVDQGAINLPAVQTQFGCSNNMYSAGLQGNNFAVNFGNFTPPDPNLKYELKYDLKLDTFDYKEFVGGIGVAPELKFFSNFNMYLDVKAFNVDGLMVNEYKEFVGLKLDSLFGYASGGDLKLMGDGSVELDPTIPGGFGVLSFYDTPVPEPTSMLLVGSGLASAAATLRRKRKAKA